MKKIWEEGWLCDFDGTRGGSEEGGGEDGEEASSGRRFVDGN